MTIFNSDDNQDQASFVDQLVGEDKKYKSVEALAKSRLDADLYIENLKREAAELREELQAKLTIKEAITPTPAPKEQPPVEPAPAITPDLNKLVRDNIQEYRQQERIAQNVETVANKMVEIYGDETKANEVVRQKAAELGVSIEFLQDVAAKSPKAFFAQIGITDNSSPKATPAPSQGNVNPAAVHSGGAKEGTYAWYENIRKTNSQLYFSPKIQNQLMKDALSKGDAFFAQ